MYIRPAMQAIDATNIQHGLPTSSQWLALDIDRPWDHELIDPAPAHRHPQSNAYPEARLYSVCVPDSAPNKSDRLFGGMIK